MSPTTPDRHDAQDQDAAASEATATMQRSLELLWEGRPPAAKGPKPGLSLDQIIATAIDIADAEGVEGLSMRRIASELGVGAMSLYRYVPDKDALLNLLIDRVHTPTRTQDDRGRSWREALEAEAWEGRALYLRHPWLLQVNLARPVLGPNSIAGLDLSMSRLADLPLRDREKMTILSALDAYVTGSVRQQILHEKAAEESGLSDEEFWSVQLPTLERAMGTGDFPVLAAMDEDAFDGGWEETFASGLHHLLDGLAAAVANREVEAR